MARIAKLLVHVAGVLTTMVATGVIAGQAAAVATAFVGLLSAIVLYLVPNKPAPAP